MSLENSSMSGAHENACSTDLFALSISLSPFPVTTTAIVSSGPVSPARAILRNPAKPVTPAGSPKTPEERASSGMAESISPSVTVTAVPPVFLMALSAFAQFLGAPTEMLSAIVSAGPKSTLSEFSIIALYIGLEPSA